MIKPNEQQRLARIEAICNSIRADMDDVLETAYNQAVAEKDEYTASELARKIRNKLLANSDNEMTIDRVGFDLSSASAFLNSLKTIIQNPWSTYRQHLRDIPQQEGFPFSIDWGISPNDIKETENRQEE